MASARWWSALLPILLVLGGCASGDDTSAPVDGPATTTSETTSSTTPAVIAAGTTTGSIDVGGTTRTYRLHVPAGLTEADAVPLLVALHGGGGSGAQYSAASGWEDVADAERFVAVLPDGTGLLPTWNAGACCGAAVRDGVDDVAFIEALVDELVDTLPIDPDKVVATGHSNGSTMSYRLACELADRIVAIGVQAAPLTYEDCAPSEPVSVLHVHGAGDQNVPVGGGRGTRGLSGLDWPPVLDGLGLMAAANGCEPEPTASTADGATRTVWSDCEAEVELVVVAAGGHPWMRPGADVRGAADAGDFDTTATIWEFLSRQLP